MKKTRVILLVTTFKDNKYNKKKVLYVNIAKILKYLIK